MILTAQKKKLAKGERGRKNNNMINIENPIYRINNEEVSREEFYNKLEELRHVQYTVEEKSHCCVDESDEEIDQLLTITAYLYIRKPGTDPDWYLFSISNPEIDQLVEDLKEVNLPDVDDLDALDTAFRLYKKGYKKISPE